jgi:hypothetical protein
MTIHRDKFAINLSSTKQVLHGVGICHDFGSAKQDIMTQFLDCEDNEGDFLLMIVFQGWS